MDLVRTSQLAPDQQFSVFLAALFHRNDLIEVRAIQNRESGTRVVERGWRRAFTTSLLFADSQKLNQEGANIYFGVNPRIENAGTKQSVAECRSVWADFDNIDLDTAKQRWQRLLPEPTVIVNSGHGIHAYWRLTQPFNVQSLTDRQRFEGMLKHLYADLGADSTQDVSRLLRLPGLMNVKGDEPVKCELISQSDARTPLRIFARWFAQSEANLSANTLPPATTRRATERAPETVSTIDQLVSSLDLPNPDRSRRDFAVVCELLRNGVAPSAIRELVAGHSKFVSEAYIEATIRNAVEATR